jgi:hypothetical protein
MNIITQRDDETALLFLQHINRVMEKVIYVHKLMSTYQLHRRRARAEIRVVKIHKQPNPEASASNNGNLAKFFIDGSPDSSFSFIIAY